MARCIFTYVYKAFQPAAFIYMDLKFTAHTCISDFISGKLNILKRIIFANSILEHPSFLQSTPHQINKHKNKKAD